MHESPQKSNSSTAAQHKPKTHPQLAGELQDTEQQTHVCTDPANDEHNLNNLAQHDLAMACIKRREV